MILLDIAKSLKEEAGYENVPITDLISVLRDGFKVIKNMALKEGTDFSLQIPKVGTFKVLKKQARMGFNPQTKEKIQIPEKHVLKFRASYLMKQALEEAFAKKKGKKPEAKAPEKPAKKAKKK